MKRPSFLADQESECERYVARTLHDLGFDDPDALQLGDIVMTEWAVVYAEGPDDPKVMGLMRQRKGWAIRRADFDVLKALLPWASAPVGLSVGAILGGAAIATSVGIASAGIALIASAYLLYCNATEKGAELNPIQLRVLAFLKSQDDGATVEMLADDLSSLDGGKVTTEDVEKLLMDLKEVPLNGGGTGAFATYHPVSGRWRSLV